MRTPGRRLYGKHLIVGGAVGVAPALCAAQLVVVPNSLATTEGAGANAFPLGNISQAHRNQQVYAASEFAAVPGPHRITGVRFRPNGTTSFTPWSATITLDLRFSVTQADPDELVATFASNVGTNETIVYSGQATYGTTQTGPDPAPPMDFDIEIIFQTPFVYDPAAGNLLMDLNRTTTNIPGNKFLDSVSVLGDGVSRVYTSTANDPTGTVDSQGVVTQFIMEPVAAGCYANCDASTAAPVLNVQDFTCFLQKFAAADAYANCDQSTAAPVLNVQDFTCFLQKFAAGCP